ncbi:MAG: anthranilate synthase component I [Acidobacteria bacterium]|nr:anthranilate synthase component I [Acidobacteriota bacterium]
MITPDLKTVSRLARQGNVIPVCHRITADLLTPVSAYLGVARGTSHAFLLESVEGGEKIARYSFMGADPYRIVRYRLPRTGEPGSANEPRAEIIEGGRRQERLGNIFSLLRQLTREYRPVRVPGLPPFAAGAVGYFGYDVVRLLERLPARATDDLGLDDARLMFFSDLLAFDHARHQILLIANIFRDHGPGSLAQKYRHACDTLRALEARLARAPRHERRPQPRPRRLAVRSNVRRADYLAAVRRGKRYIRAGDIYQVVLSQRFASSVRADPFSLYRALRIINPSPYMYFLRLGDFDVLGSSPEMLVKVQGRNAFYRPIAGTRPRGQTEEEDRRLEQQLRHSVKERAEHIMLVDLGRNDLGRVCEYGTVKVEELMFVERYSHVMHLVSSLRGRLRRDVDCFDALAACFPAGTVTGAPKVRAMEIIDELEPTRRGVYSGCVCYLDFSGNLDSCIAIRTMVVRGGVAYVQAGGGVVADSGPAREYQETVNKAQALLTAVELAEKGLT